MDSTNINTHKTIFVIDDDSEICSGLRFLLESVNLKVETYTSAEKFLAEFDPARQGCLILDVRMPIMTGIDLLDKLNLEKNSSLPVIVITGYADIPVAVRAMKAGAVDFILKPINENYLLEKIYHYLNNPLAKNLPHFEVQTNSLTKREKEIMDLIAKGMFNKEIAYELNISIATVEVHRSRIMRKYKAKNLAQLIKRYFNIPDNYYQDSTSKIK